MNTKSLVLGIIVVITFSGVGFFAIQKSAPPQSSDPSPIEIWKQTQTALAASVAHSIIDPVLDNDPFAVSMNISEIRNNIVGLSYLIIVNKNGKILLHPDSSQIMQDYNPTNLQPLDDKKNVIQSIKKDDKEIFDIAVPVSLEGVKQGEIHLGIIKPWNDEQNAEPSNLAKILIIAAAFIGLVLTIIGAVGASKPAKTITPTISKNEIEKLKKEKEELTANIGELKREITNISKQKTQVTGDETKLSETIAKLRTEETKLTESIDEKKAEFIKLEQKHEAMGASPSDIDDFKDQLSSKDSELEELKNQIENMKAKLDAKPRAETPLPTEDIEEIKKEELELTQRIVKKRREEIILSQKVESKRKEELALERKIEALTKKLKEMGKTS